MPIISFMPYFPDEQVDRLIGDFRIWNWNRHRERIEIQTRNYLDRYFSLFVRSDGAPEPRIAILSEEGANPFPLEAGFRKRELSRLATSLMACYLFRLPVDPNAGWMACSSDNFLALHQTFEPAAGEGGVAFEYGSYFRVRVLGGWDHLRFATPNHVPNPRGATPNDDLLDRIARLLPAHDLRTERGFRSFNWLAPAFANYDATYYSRLVAMATAFEILLDFPDRGKSAYFSQRLNQLIPPNRLPVSTRRWGPRNRQTSDNDVGWWCRSFYDLRSRIVHGDVIPNADILHRPGVEHLRIALTLFEECVRGLLIEMGQMGEDERQQDFWFYQPWVEQLQLPKAVWY